MDDFALEENEPRWISGFESDRRVVLARLGPYRRLFPKPKNYTQRFHHRIYELTIEEWQIPLSAPQPSPLCQIGAELRIRFQPTLAFAAEQIEAIGSLGDFIRQQYRTLLQDTADTDLQAFTSASWLEKGTEPVARRIEDIVHELLAIREIQSRCHCHIEANFAEIDSDHLNEDLVSIEPGRREVAEQILKRQRAAAESMARAQMEQKLIENRLKLEKRERELEMLREETELLRRREDQESALARESLMAEERRQTERIESENRLRREQIEHESQLKRLEIEAILRAGKSEQQNLGEAHAQLKEEIELLSMEHRRLTLEEEIHTIKKSRAHGWFSGMKNRYLTEDKG